MSIEGQPFISTELLHNRLQSYWLPDENILYIGQTENNLRQRIQQFYKTELGQSKPHAGGHWIKTLTILPQTSVHYLSTTNSVEIEEQLLTLFSASVSLTSKQFLDDPGCALPFGNLQLNRSRRKKHGIKKSKLIFL
jgi:hypothetical protein